MPEPKPPKSAPKRRHLRRAGIWSLVTMMLLAAVSAGLAFYLIGRPVTAPDWVQSRIEARLAQTMPQARMQFGEMVFIVDEGWRPRVRLSDVELSTPAGATIAAFREVRASLSLRGLRDGMVQPRNILVDGATATLSRDAAGRVSLSGGAGGARQTRREAATLPQLIADLDRLLQQPALRKLRSAELRGLTLNYADARAGRRWTVDGGRLRLTREGDALTLGASLALLGGGADAATLEANYSSRIGQLAADFGVSFTDVAAADIAVQGPAFAWLEVLDAPISGSVRSGLNERGGFAPINATLQIGAGAVQPNPEAQPVPFDGVRSYFSYNPATSLLRFDELSVRSQWVSLRAEGDAVLGGVDAGALTDLVAQFQLRDMVANPADLYAEPVSLAAADVDLQVKLNPFRVTLGRLQIDDQGQTLNLQGRLAAGASGWQVAVDGRMDGLAPDRLLTLWPERLKPKTRRWLAENLFEGALSNIDVAFRRTPGTAPQTYLAFDYDKANVRYLKTLPPIVDGKGHASLADNRFVVTVDKGRVLAPQGGAVALGGSSFIMPDVRVKDGPPGIVRLETRSTLTAMLSLLNQPPLRVMDKTDLPVTLADGEAVLQGTLAFPLKKGGGPEAVEYDVSGDLLAVRSDTLVKGRALSAPNLSVSASNELLTIGGAGQLDGIGFDGTWAQPIGKGVTQSRLSADVAITPEALAAFNVALPPGTLSGKGKGRLDVTLVKGEAPGFSLRSDLRGVRLAVPQVSWVKPAAASGRLQVSGQLGAVPRVEQLAVEGPGLRARGSVRLGNGGTLERVRFDRVAVGGWLDAPVDLIGQGRGRPVQVVVRGGTLDMRRAEFARSRPSGVASPPLLLALDRLQITDQIALTGMTGRFDLANGLDGAFEARLNGGAPVRGRVVPQNGRSAVQMTSADAGGVLRSAAVIRQVVGGDLSLTLLPVGSGGAFDGRLAIRGVTIRDAPAIAALVNAVSVVGLVNELNGDGIYFDDVEADFRLTPNRVTLTKASAVGSSLGISMDGVFATDTGRLNMQGVISPVYLLNGLGSFLTRKGEGLIGFNYALRGTARQPSVSVNPLSALTPGMFREIFRAPPPELPSVEGIARSTLPAPPPPPRQNEVARPGEDR